MIVDGLSLNLYLLETGYAWWYQKYAPGCDACRHSAEKARLRGLGLWSQPNPIPPWEWRKGLRI